MSTNIYTREECKKLIDELGIISYKTQMRLCKKKITPPLMESILYYTEKCKDNLSEKIYWILNDIEDYPFCQECGKQIKPGFYGLKCGYVGGRFCSSKCANNNIEIKEKMKKTCEQRYGTAYVLQINEVREKGKLTCQERYGVEHPSQSMEIQEKKKQTCLKHFGVEHQSQSLEVKEKTKQTWLQNYGTEHPSQSDNVKAKKKQTCLERYGVEYSFQLEEFKEKSKQTCLEKYNVEYSTQSDKINQKRIETCLTNHNTEYPFQSEEIREKSKKTWLEKYNVINPSQDINIFNKIRSSSYKLKELVLPSGKIITYQGYENVAYLKLLEDGYLEEQIIIETDFIPQVKYQLNNIDKVYYPDIFIPHENKIIEVKSIWTYEKDLDKNLTKRQACLDQGYQFEFWICSDKKLLEIK